ncbi:alpha/beta fold hydrolase [Streptomyces sp. NPDC002536]
MMIELKRTPLSTRREVHRVRRPGADLALHVWRPQEIKGVVFYFHGLQSHAGWLWETGPQFAANDIAFCVLDRRGSGISDGPRNEIADTDTVIGDYAAALAAVRRMAGEDSPLSLFGHCLGGSVMAAAMHHPAFDTRYDAAVFCSAWPGKLHATLTEDQLRALAREESTETWDAGLKAADFTDVPKYRHYIENDDLAVHRLTRRSRRTLLELEQLYMSPARGGIPDVPTVYVSGITDPIVDLDDAHKTFISLTSGRGSIIKLPADKHYLFFTDVRTSLVNWASTFTLVQGLEQHG